MNEHQGVILEALSLYRGDNLERARLAFKGMTDDQLQQRHGKWPITRAELLALYEKHNDKINAAIEWVNTVVNNSVAAEREACAALAERTKYGSTLDLQTGILNCGCAAAIRQRGAAHGA